MRPDSIHGRLEIFARGLLRRMIRDAADWAKHHRKKKYGRGAKPVPPHRWTSAPAETRVTLTMDGDEDCRMQTDNLDEDCMAQLVGG